MKTLKNLINKYCWNDIATRFVLYYPHQVANIDGYECAFDILKSLKADDDSEYEIIIERVDMGGESFYEVYGVTEGLLPGSPVETIALEYQDWEEWLSMTFSAETEKALPDIDKIVHVLFEMTAAGWDPSGVAVERKELLKRYDKARKQAGKDASAKELFAKLQNDFKMMSDELD